MSGFSLHKAQMRLAAEARCAVPLEVAFDAATDIPALETKATRAGAEIARLADGLDGARPAWRVQGHYRGGMQAVVFAVGERREDESVTLFGHGTRLTFQLRMIFLARGPETCALRWDLALGPYSIAGRLMIPALKLARRRLEQRMVDGLELFARSIEADYEPLALRKGAAG